MSTCVKYIIQERRRGTDWKQIYQKPGPHIHLRAPQEAGGSLQNSLGFGLSRFIVGSLWREEIYSPPLTDWDHQMVKTALSPSLAFTDRQLARVHRCCFCSFCREKSPAMPPFFWGGRMSPLKKTNDDELLYTKGCFMFTWEGRIDIIKQRAFVPFSCRTFSLVFQTKPLHGILVFRACFERFSFDLVTDPTFLSSLGSGFLRCGSLHHLCTFQPGLWGTKLSELKGFNLSHLSVEGFSHLFSKGRCDKVFIPMTRNQETHPSNKVGL